jgi:predicted transcriptional regulator YdeE
MKSQSFARMPEIKVVGISIRTRYEDPTAAREIDNLWQKFYEEKLFDKIPHKSQPHRVIALYTDYDKTGSCVLVLGAQVNHYELDTMPNGMIFKTIPAAHYALFSDAGALKSVVPELWKTIWADKKLQRTFKYDFESYNYPIDMHDGSVDIYVGVHGKL